MQNAAVYVKTIVRESHQFEEACLKKKKTDFGVLATFWFSTFVMLLQHWESSRSIRKMNGTVRCHKDLNVEIERVHSIP